MADLTIGLRRRISYVSFEPCSKRGNVHSFRHPEVVRLEQRYRWEEAYWRCVILSHLDSLVVKVRGQAVDAQERRKFAISQGSTNQSPSSVQPIMGHGGLTRPQAAA
jgi:hypothetical protein